MGDDRAGWEVTEAVLQDATDRAAAALDDDSRPHEVVRPAATRAGGELAEVLRIRWDTPRGRKIRAQVIRDVRFEQSAHLGEILSDLRGSSELPGYHDLRYVRLEGENLSHARLAKVDLTGASLAKTGLVSADLSDARLVKARLVAAALREANLSRADLADANLTEANLEGATVVSASLGRARCIGAVFRGASLVGADLRGAMLVRAVFDIADLGGASVDGAHALAGAFARATQQPSGLAALNEIVLASDSAPSAPGRPEAARIERTGTGSLILRRGNSTDTRPVPLVAPAPVDRSPTPAPSATKSWDTALAGLLLQRGRVSRITVVVDGMEKVVFER